MCVFPDTVIRDPFKALIVSYSHYLPCEQQQKLLYVLPDPGVKLTLKSEH